MVTIIRTTSSYGKSAKGYVNLYDVYESHMHVSSDRIISFLESRGFKVYVAQVHRGRGMPGDEVFVKKTDSKAAKLALKSFKQQSEIIRSGRYGGRKTNVLRTSKKKKTGRVFVKSYKRKSTVKAYTRKKPAKRSSKKR